MAVAGLHDHPGTSEPGSGTHSGTTVLSVSGMTCNNCARHVAEAIQEVPGVRTASVDLDAQQASIRWKAEDTQDLPAVLKALNEAGYPSKEIAREGAAESRKGVSGWTLNLLLGIPVTLILMLGEWVLGIGMARWFQWLGFALAGVVQVFAGARFYKGAFSQLKAGRSNMDTLVSLGSTTAFAYSAWALLSGHGGHVYFMEASAIITLISVGHWLESRMAVKASGALRRLLDLAPAMARKVEPGGTIREVPLAELKSEDKFELKPGDKVPTDGVVVEGESVADESMLTGESVPVEKAAGAEVYGGTVNLNGRLIVRVTAVGEQTALANIVAAVRRAQSSRADIQRLGDRVSSVFVPIVVAIALLSALWWGLAPESARGVNEALSRFLWSAHVPFGSVAVPFIIAAAVLIVACPCAMGLATPAAIMAGSNAAAQKGILVRDGVALEKAGKVNAVLFDKTGTLTVGKPSVERIWANAESNGGEALGAVATSAARLARHSTHPISQAIAHTQKQVDDTTASFQEIRGAGVQGTENGATVRLGSLRWLSESGVDISKGAAFKSEWTGKGATVVGYAKDAKLEGLFAIRDALKPAAKQVVQMLNESGLQVYMVTGDNKATAQAIAAECGIDAANVFAEVRPEDKAKFIRELQGKGKKVAFVGDGINDAPGLEQADLGIAVSRASDIAREAADIILLRSEIEAVPESLGLARATLRTIKQNLFWAFFYNALGVPLAALGFMSPILCAAAMGFSDTIVIGNALRLRRWKLRRKGLW